MFRGPALGSMTVTAAVASPRFTAVRKSVITSATCAFGQAGFRSGSGVPAASATAAAPIVTAPSIVLTDPNTLRRMNRVRFPGLADGWARLDAPGGSQPVD